MGFSTVSACVHLQARTRQKLLYGVVAVEAVEKYFDSTEYKERLSGGE